MSHGSIVVRCTNDHPSFYIISSYNKRKLRQSFARTFCDKNTLFDFFHLIGNFFNGIMNFNYRSKFSQLS